MQVCSIFKELYGMHIKESKDSRVPGEFRVARSFYNEKTSFSIEPGNLDGNYSWKSDGVSTLNQSMMAQLNFSAPPPLLLDPSSRVETTRLSGLRKKVKKERKKRRNKKK